MHSTLLSLIATAILTTATPIVPNYSLNLSPDLPHFLFKREAAACNVYIAPTQDVVNCANYLTSLGQQPCQVNGPGSISTFCTSGKAAVVGINVAPVPNGPTSSPCVDVARAVGFILDDCTNNEGLGDMTGGQIPAYGNGFLNVQAGGLNGPLH